MHGILAPENQAKADDDNIDVDFVSSKRKAVYARQQFGKIRFAADSDKNGRMKEIEQGAIG